MHLALQDVVGVHDDRAKQHTVCLGAYGLQQPCETVYNQFEIDNWIEFDRILRVS